MSAVVLSLPRFLLRDFNEHDRPAFLRYQLDPRYLALYDYESTDHARAEQLFDLFMNWRVEIPRNNYQLGIFEQLTGNLLGSAGLRSSAVGVAVLGIELAPAEWGRFRLAFDVIGAMLPFGFERLQLETILGDTASGNKRVEKLAKHFGARIVASRAGPPWMQTRGWQEVDWALDRQVWELTRTAASADL